MTAGTFSLKTSGTEVARPIVSSARLGQHLVLAVVVQPHDLEQVVPFDESILVVVNRLAGPRQQAGRVVLLAQDELGVRVRALERDPDRHLVDRAAGQRKSPAERLRPEQDVQPERPPLPHESVEQQGALLRHAVVLDEELLKLVDDEQDSRAGRVLGRHPDLFRFRLLGHLRLVLGPALAVQIFAILDQRVNAGVAEQVTAFLQDAVEPLQYAQSELPLALDGDGLGVRQSVHGVRLDSTPFLKSTRYSSTSSGE